MNRFPDDWSAWWNYADDLHHWGPMIGITNAEMRAALQRTVDLNPKLVPMWDHLFDASVGHDSAQAALAVKSLTALGHETEYTAACCFPRAGNSRCHCATASLWRLPGPRDWLHRVMASVFSCWRGYPAAQIELNRRLIALAPHDSLTHYVWEGMAQFLGGTWRLGLYPRRVRSLGCSRPPDGRREFSRSSTRSR